MDFLEVLYYLVLYSPVIAIGAFSKENKAIYIICALYAVFDVLGNLLIGTRPYDVLTHLTAPFILAYSSHCIVFFARKYQKARTKE